MPSVACQGPGGTGQRAVSRLSSTPWAQAASWVWRGKARVTAGAGAGSCSAADTCDSSGQCQPNDAPAGAGKTLVGAAAMALAKATTLILVTNIVSARQWKRELVARTSLTEDETAATNSSRAISDVVQAVRTHASVPAS